MADQLQEQLAFVNAKYQGRIAEVNGRIEALKQEIENRLQANADLESNLVSRSAADKARFARIRAAQNEEVDGYYERKLAELDDIADRSFGIDEQVFLLRNKQRTLQTEINHLINQNQIYRLAMYVDGKESATEVERSTVGLVALLWFGSLSLIAAVCGVILAVAGFYLRRFSDPGEEMDDLPGAAAPSDIFVDEIPETDVTAREPMRAPKRQQATG